MNVFQQLINNYNKYHVSGITTNRFSPENFQSIIQPLSTKFNTTQLGKSVEGRPINSITLGNGPIKVLLWSQMHGNESTATRAILDILQFMDKPKELATIQQNILDKLTICMVPMVNPDGIVQFKRRNALDIDINRDAREFTAPESQILKTIITNFKPDYAFNLHDQRRYYNISGTSKPSTIAFLAPAYNALEDINPARRTAMQLIAHLREQLETVIPGQIGIYDDTYTPRAFGDYTQSTGVSTILVESGWERNDPEKELVRKMNFSLLISAFESIAEDSLINFSVDDYMTIPMNDEHLFDLLIRNIYIEKNNRRYNIDIGIQRNEVSKHDETGFYAKGEITDIGDLNDWYGFTEVTEHDLIALPGLVWQEPYAELNDITLEKAVDLVKQGYIFFKAQGEGDKSYVELPINVVNDGFIPHSAPVFEGTANLLLMSLAGELKYVVINGFLWKLDEPMPENINGLVL